mgnify:CR=1 FL=1
MRMERRKKAVRRISREGRPPAACVLGVLLLLAAGGAEAEEPGKAAVALEGAFARHDYTVKLRPAAWMVFVEGDYETQGPFGVPVSVGVRQDLGYDDPYPSFSGEAGLRWGRHDFWITGIYISESESEPITFAFEVADQIFDVNGRVVSSASLTDVNFRYGYSFFDFKTDGFRFGPTIAVSYTDIELEITELSVFGVPTGERFSFEETLPIPTVGVHAEVPFGEVLFSAQMSGLYGETSDFEALGFRGEAGLTWRPTENLGFFAGLSAIYVDLDLENERIDDLLFWGPTVGLEIRF